jgi:ABC-type protease/lipase transport system fused ATPase/permease subunit
MWLEEHARVEAARAGSSPALARLTDGIRFRNVTFGYPGTDRTVLDGFDVTLPAGSTVALVSENGARRRSVCRTVRVAVRRLPLTRVQSLDGLLDQYDAVGQGGRRDLGECEAEIAVGLFVDLFEDK